MGRGDCWTISLMSFRDERNYCDNQNYTASFLSARTVGVLWIIHFANVLLALKIFGLTEKSIRPTLWGAHGNTLHTADTETQVVTSLISKFESQKNLTKFCLPDAEAKQELCMILRGSGVNSSKCWHQQTATDRWQSKYPPVVILTTPATNQLMPGQGWI